MGPGVLQALPALQGLGTTNALGLQREWAVIPPPPPHSVMLSSQELRYPQELNKVKQEEEKWLPEYTAAYCLSGLNHRYGLLPSSSVCSAQEWPGS